MREIPGTPFSIINSVSHLRESSFYNSDIGTVVHYIILDLLKEIFYVKNPDSILLETSCLFACFYS